MAFLTIFTAPKPFTNAHIATIQRNALLSWLQLGTEIEVLLIGKESGMADVALEFNFKHLPDVACNQKGTPLISSIFDLARQNSDSPFMAYINADIMVLPDFLGAARAVAKKASKFLIVGQRWNLDVPSPLEFSPDWQVRLRERVQSDGKLHLPAGSDYFIFPRECFPVIPAFSIGRAGWDNWMIYEARRQHWLVVDATHDVTIIHQNHDYSHLPGGQRHYKLPESDENVRLAGGREMTRFILLDANRRLVNGRLCSRHWTTDVLRRAIESYPLLKWNNYKLTERITTTIRRIHAKVERE